MGQVTSCAGKRPKPFSRKKQLSFNSDEPRLKKRNNSRRQSKIFPSVSENDIGPIRSTSPDTDDVFTVEPTDVCEKKFTNNDNKIVPTNCFHDGKLEVVDENDQNSKESTPYHNKVSVLNKTETCIPSLTEERMTCDTNESMLNHTKESSQTKIPMSDQIKKSPVQTGESSSYDTNKSVTNPSKKSMSYRSSLPTLLNTTESILSPTGEYEFCDKTDVTGMSNRPKELTQNHSGESRERAEESVSYKTIEQQPPIRNKSEVCDTSDKHTLEKRQLEIISRLTALQKEVEMIANDAGVTFPDFSAAPARDTSSSSGITTKHATSACTLTDIVISADPMDPPLSLFVLYEMLKRQRKLIGRVHVHSSVTTVPERLTKVFVGSLGERRSDYEVAVTLIWKKAEFGPTLMISGHCHTPIIGEAAILRYLGRLLNPPYDNGDPITTTLIDDWIDTAFHQLREGKQRERSTILKSINAKLGASEWLVGEGMTLADIAVWSILYRTEEQKTLPTKVEQWMKKYCNIDDCSLAISVMSNTS